MTDVLVVRKNCDQVALIFSARNDYNRDFTVYFAIDPVGTDPVDHFRMPTKKMMRKKIVTMYLEIL